MRAVAVGGVEWQIHSRNERSCSVGDRHFMAARCSSSRGWTIEEINQAEPQGSRFVADVGEGIETRNLTQAVLRWVRRNTN